MNRRSGIAFCVEVFFLASVFGAPPESVNESARQIPMAYQVDVVVVGGSTGAVSAAVAAAQAGAKVFLAAPRPYLGDDMTATLRLWVEKDTHWASVLAKALFATPKTWVGRSPNWIAFSYESDAPSQPPHRDTEPPSKLSDGLWGLASTESVQYADDVTIIADLKESRPIAEVRVVVYQRTEDQHGSPFKVQSVSVSTSNDKSTWKLASVIENFCNEKEIIEAGDECHTLSARIAAQARYVRFQIKKAPEAKRILLGEIEIVAPAQRHAEKAIMVLKPMHIKKTLDDALLQAGVQFLYSCYPTHVLRDAQDMPCGIVMANRAGRQAVVAKVIIDATDRATVARMAMARFQPYPAGLHTFKRVVIGGEPRTEQGLSARVIDSSFSERVSVKSKPTPEGIYPVIEYTLNLFMPDGSFPTWARADQQARTLTYHTDQQFTSDVLYELPPDPVQGQESATGTWQGTEKLPLGAFRPDGVERIFVLGGSADISREQAVALMHPVNLINVGARVGAAAAAEAKSLPSPVGVRVLGETTSRPAAAGDVHEILIGVRPTQCLPTIPQEAGAVPVLGSYDVVVVGGGTAGAPAGIGAARQGAKTLVVEYLSGLGGVGTLGAIASYCMGNRVGFTATVQGSAKEHATWSIEQKAEWWRSELLEAGADIWFGVIGCGAWVENGRVAGVVVATPQGRGVVLAKIVIDATGNSDIAAAAGAQCIYTDASEFGMQGTGLPFRRPGVNLTNTDYTITDETDMVDVWHLFVYAKRKFNHAFDLGQLVDTRERRRIVGDFTMTVLDQIAERTYPDTIVQAKCSSYDTHGYMVDRFFALTPPPSLKGLVNIPYRSMLPRGLDGILVVGLGISAHRDAVPLIRMQPDIQNGGYAAGVAAALAVKMGVTPRKVDLRTVQRHLVEIGNLTPSVLTDKDSFPLPPEQIAMAVKDAPKNAKALAIVFAHAEAALPFLRAAYASAEDFLRLSYASILATLGHPTGVDVLLEHVSKSAWDTGWKYHHDGRLSMSPLDGKIVALGWAGDRRAVPVIVEKLMELKPHCEFSHFRAAALALELLADPAAAKPLADVLSLPGISGYAHTSLDAAVHLEVERRPSSDFQTRAESLRELMLARALYRCGDYKGLGAKILRAYAQDLRGHLARHARGVLDTGVNHPR